MLDLMFHLYTCLLQFTQCTQDLWVHQYMFPLHQLCTINRQLFIINLMLLDMLLIMALDMDMEAAKVVMAVVTEVEAMEAGMDTVGDMVVMVSEAMKGVMVATMKNVVKMEDMVVVVTADINRIQLFQSIWFKAGIAAKCKLLYVGC